METTQNTLQFLLRAQQENVFIVGFYKNKNTRFADKI